MASLSRYSVPGSALVRADLAIRYPADHAVSPSCATDAYEALYTPLAERRFFDLGFGRYVVDAYMPMDEHATPPVDPPAARGGATVRSATRPWMGLVRTLYLRRGAEATAKCYSSGAERGRRVGEPCRSTWTTSRQIPQPARSGRNTSFPAWFRSCAMPTQMFKKVILSNRTMRIF